MIRKLKFRKLGQRDLTGHYNYIKLDSVDAAERFVNRVKETLNDLLSYPEMGRNRSSKSQRLKIIRFLPVKDFEKYLIFYRPAPAKISVLRVLHSSRDIDRILGL